MYISLEIINRVFALDFGWLLDLALSNILWVFVLAAVAAFFYDKRNWFWGFALVTMYVLASTDFAKVVGWVIFDKTLLAFLMIAGLIVLVFAETDTWGSKHLALLNTVRFIVVMAFFNLFL